MFAFIYQSEDDIGAISVVQALFFNALEGKSTFLPFSILGFAEIKGRWLILPIGSLTPVQFYLSSIALKLLA